MEMVTYILKWASIRNTQTSSKTGLLQHFAVVGMGYGYLAMARAVGLKRSNPITASPEIL